MIGLPHDEHYVELREKMVAEQLKARNITDKKVLEAMRHVPRELFVLPQDMALAYEDYPHPIGFGQTISQPYIIALMLQELNLKETDTLLEIGGGSGYAAAVAGQIVDTVYSVEIVKELYDRASRVLEKLRYHNVISIHGNGYSGLPDRAPFDAILLSAAPEQIPEELFSQLRVGGRLIAPVGRYRIEQRLVRYEKTAADTVKETELMGVSFVEMVSE